MRVYTGSRAEYNLLQPLVKKLELDNFFKVSLYASGMPFKTAWMDNR